jgi:Fe-S-cluster containining protein
VEGEPGRSRAEFRGHILISMMLPARDSELVQIMDASLADAGRRAGEWLACRMGCTQCCHGAFAINRLDAERLRAGMAELRAREPNVAAEVERRARTWMDTYGGEFPGDISTGVLGISAEEQERFEGFANEAACPALDPATGRCDVYAWRPMTCRVFGPPVRVEGGGLGCCELCFVGASDEEIAACEMHVPHELENELVGEAGCDGETVVAFALLGRT